MSDRFQRTNAQKAYVEAGTELFVELLQRDRLDPELLTHRIRPRDLSVHEWLRSPPADRDVDEVHLLIGEVFKRRSAIYGTDEEGRPKAPDLLPNAGLPDDPLVPDDPLDPGPEPADNRASPSIDGIDLFAPASWDAPERQHSRYGYLLEAAVHGLIENAAGRVEALEEVEGALSTYLDALTVHLERAREAQKKKDDADTDADLDD